MAAIFGRVIRTFAVLAFVLTACAKRELDGDPPTGGLGGAMTAVGGATGQGGAGGPGVVTGSGGIGSGGIGSGGVGSGGTGGIPRVPSGCIFNQDGTPVPIVEVLDPGRLAVPCPGARASGVVIRIGDRGGQGFDWRASIVPSSSILRPSIAGTSSCPDFGTQDVGVYAAFPDSAAVGDVASAMLRIDTTYTGLPWVAAPVSAILAPTEFALDLLGGPSVTTGTASAPLSVDFGAVPVGGVSDAEVSVRNLGPAPLTRVHPAPPLTAPFSFEDWRIGGEDPPPTPPVAPGESAPVRFWFRPSAPG